MQITKVLERAVIIEFNKVNNLTTKTNTHMYPLTKNELQNLLETCSSTYTKDGKLYFKKRAMLDEKGLPIPLDEFQKVIEANPTAPKFSFKKDPDIRRVKKEWKKTHVNFKPTVTFKLVPYNKFQTEIMLSFIEN